MASSTEEIVGNVALAVLSVDPAGGSSFVPVAELFDMTPNEISVDEVEVTHTDLTNGAKKWKAGWQDFGSWSFIFNYREDSYSALLALVGVEGANYQIEWTDPAHAVSDPNDTFIGFMQALSKPSPREGKWDITATIRIEETSTFTEGTDA